MVYILCMYDYVNSIGFVFQSRPQVIHTYTTSIDVNITLKVFSYQKRVTVAIKTDTIYLKCFLNSLMWDNHNLQNIHGV